MEINATSYMDTRNCDGHSLIFEIYTKRKATTLRSQLFENAKFNIYGNII